MTSIHDIDELARRAEKAMRGEPVYADAELVLELIASFNEKTDLRDRLSEAQDYIRELENDIANLEWEAVMRDPGCVCK